jgi:hypothetical protein
MYHAAADEWDIKKAKPGAEKKIAIVYGGLPKGVENDLMIKAATVGGFTRAMEWADHHVGLFENPNEGQFASICTDYDIVITLCHLPGMLTAGGRIYDGAHPRGQRFCGLALGGQSNTHPADQTLYQGAPGGAAVSCPKSLITANELEFQYKVNNPDLVLVVPGCRAGQTDRLWRAVGSTQAGHFAASTELTNASAIIDMYQYVVDLLNTTPAKAASNLTSKNPTYVVDPTNRD